MSERAAGGGSLLGSQLLGAALFLFIPLVLYLFVAHPEPVGASLAAGVVLMLGHRFLARPYMEAVRGRKCLWCNGRPRPRADLLPLLVGRAGRGGGGSGGVADERSADDGPDEVVGSRSPDTGAGSSHRRGAASAGVLIAVVCPHHRDAAARFVAFLERSRLPLRAGIFVPLLLLFAALLAAALGERRWLDPAVALFQLLVGITVNVAACGYFAAAPAVPARVPFPAHNFFLLGIRNLLWVLRLVGSWWIVRGTAALMSGIR